jgi:mycothiol synthase
VRSQAADLDCTNPGGGNLVGLILPISEAEQQALPQDFVTRKGDARTTTLIVMRLVEITHAPTAARRRSLLAFVEQLTARSGSRPLSDHLWLDLKDGDGSGSISVSAADERGVIALAHIAHANEGSVVEVVVDPELGDVADVHDDVLETAVDAFRGDGGGHLTWWTDEGGERAEQVAERCGLDLERSLHEMRVALPLDSRTAVGTRAFTPADADAWLRVNNAAFADHPEQGGWDRATLSARLAEPWFDPDGFRLYEQDGVVAAFCWTKVHDEMSPPVGEIYVIGVDPALHGRGLGRELTLAGLDWMSDHGLGEAMLYVDGGNVAARHLYERLGFVTQRTRFAFAGTLSA